MTTRRFLRASDADREQVAERLRIAAVEGRLGSDELEDRVGMALTAKTYGELDGLVSDLPATSLGRPRRSGVPARVRPRVLVAVAVPVALVVIAALAAALGGHSHPDHHWGVSITGGAPFVWLLWIVIGWRLFLHRRHRTR
jgi:hypothetical protein